MTLSKSEATKRIQFAYYAYVAGPMGDVFTYLLRSPAQHSNHKGKKMALEAISAFWKPFSAKALLKISDQESKQIAIRSIDRLQKQIDLIKTAFELQSYSTSITRHEIEALIDARLGQRDRISAPSSTPVPDNYNICEGYGKSATESRLT